MEFLRNELIKDKIEAKVYSASPSCFLLITDESVFVEQYHYGLPRSGLVGGHVPVLKYNKGSRVARHLIGHFDYVWQSRGTKTINELIDQYWTGISKSAWECKLINVFQSRKHAEGRIKYLLWNSTGTISLVGISLRDFLHSGSIYYQIIQVICNKSKSDKNSIKLECLLLDPRSEQGKIRTEREEPGVYPGNLYKEVDTSINRIRQFKTEKASIDARLYYGSPNAFMILTDQSVIVEQYHYGSAGSTILGGKVPLVEFSNQSPVYDEFKGHIKYLWDNLSKPELDWHEIPPQEMK